MIQDPTTSEVADFFRERAARGSAEDFLRFLDSAANEPPREGDER